MAQLTMADLQEGISYYDSSRDVGDVLIGEDSARLLIEASSSGNDTAVQSLLSQPQWIKTMLEQQHRIYDEAYGEEPQPPGQVRSVRAWPMLNLYWATTRAALNGHAAVVSTLLAFAKDHGIDPLSVVSKIEMCKILKVGDTAMVRALVSADPNFVNMIVGHSGVLPLYEAVRMRHTDMAAVLLEFGADPLHPIADPDGGTKRFMAFAALHRGPRMTEMLLEHGVPIAGSWALHNAAARGELDTMRLLIQHGADLDGLFYKDRTPMHNAASSGKVDAIKLLEQSGARSDLEDEDGKTPAQLLEEYNTA